MSSTIRSYLQVFPILWWCCLLLIASWAVALFPFDDMSFAYVIKPNVLAVIAKTLGIGAVILVVEFWLGYQVFQSDFWQRAPGRAILIHALGGVALPATIIFGMILLMYPPTIVDDDRFQWDIIFMVLLLIVLNFWLANRMLLYYVNIMQDIGQKQAGDKDILVQRVEFLSTEIKHYKSDAQQYEALIATTDKTANGLLEARNLLAMQLEDLRTETSRQLDRVQQLENECKTEFQKRILAEGRMQELLLELAELKASVRHHNEGSINQKDRAEGVFYFKVKDIEIAVFERDIAYCYGHHHKGEDSFQEIVLMDGTRYHPGLKSLSDLLRAFPSLRHVSRNYLISGQAIVAYGMLSGGIPLLKLVHHDEQVEYGESYRRKHSGWKNWLAEQIAINQKKFAL